MDLPTDFTAALLCVILPADEVDDGFVFEVGVRRAGTSSFVRQLQDVILVGEFPARLAAVHHRAGSPNAHSYNTIRTHVIQNECASSCI